MTDVEVATGSVRGHAKSETARRPTSLGARLALAVLFRATRRGVLVAVISVKHVQLARVHDPQRCRPSVPDATHAGALTVSGARHQTSGDAPDPGRLVVKRDMT